MKPAVNNSRLCLHYRLIRQRMTVHFTALRILYKREICRSHTVFMSVILRLNKVISISSLQGRIQRADGVSEHPSAEIWSSFTLRVIIQACYVCC